MTMTAGAMPQQEPAASRIHFTDSAASRIAELLAEEDAPELKLRLFVEGGGCSGFSYGFMLDEQVRDDDISVEGNGVALIVDALSYHQLVGAKIDCKDGPGGMQFVIDNPNESSGGCGSSCACSSEA